MPSLRRLLRRVGEGSNDVSAAATETAIGKKPRNAAGLAALARQQKSIIRIEERQLYEDKRATTRNQ